MSKEGQPSTGQPSTRQPPPTHEATSHWADFSEVARGLFGAGSVDDTLALIVHLAVTAIEGCDFAGVFRIDDGHVTTPAQSAPIVVEADALQTRTGEGPCIDVMAHGSPVYAADLADDPRWPNFGPQATELGMRSLLALPLLDHGVRGALNLYATYPSAFGALDRARGLLLGSLAAVALSAALTHEADQQHADSIIAALATRELIGQAQGILMERDRITADQAFDLLRRASQHLNVKLREVARRLVETGEQPDTGPRG